MHGERERDRQTHTDKYTHTHTHTHTHRQTDTQRQRTGGDREGMRIYVESGRNLHTITNNYPVYSYIIMHNTINNYTTNRSYHATTMTNFARIHTQ